VRVHADEIDPFGAGVFGVRPDVEELTLGRRLVAQSEIRRATREAEETRGGRGEKVASRRFERIRQVASPVGLDGEYG